MKRQPYYDIAKQYLPQNHDSVIVDIGCGIGEFLDHCQLSVGYSNVYPLDGNQETVFTIKNRYSKSSVYVAPDKLPFKNEEVEYIHTSHLIEHLETEDLYKFLVEVDRVLSPGGIFIISTPLLWEGFYNDLTHKRPYNPESIQHYLCTDSHNRSKNQINNKYRVLDLQYRYMKTEHEYLGSEIKQVDLFLYLIHKLSLKLFKLTRLKKNGYTMVLKKEREFDNNISTNNKKLVMTLLARDEADIIKDNIEYHLSHGVDFIIATDNGSVDGTREILEELQKKGKLLLIDEPGRDKSQADWVNKMAKIAIKEYQADYIFHCDADEFWCPLTGNLKTEIARVDSDYQTVGLINVVLEDKNGKEKFPDDAKYSVTRPILAENHRIESENRNMYLYKFLEKVIIKTNKGLLRVTQGNHEVIADFEPTHSFSDNIKIYHFPLRGKERFFNKVIITGKAVEENVKLKPTQSWHIRRWYTAYKNGKLNIEYKRLLFSKKEAREYIDSGVISLFNFKRFIEGNQ